MIRHIRALALDVSGEMAADVISGLGSPRANAAQPDDPQVDASLDVLVKHAILSDIAEPDAARIWECLRSRVAGPFGRIAVEGPICTGTTATEGTQQAPFAVESRVRPRYNDQCYSDAMRCLFLTHGTGLSEARSALR